MKSEKHNPRPRPPAGPGESTQPTQEQRDPGGPSFQIETLEQRILLSATWTDADTGQVLPGPTDGDEIYTGDNAADVADALAGNDVMYGDIGADTLHGGAGNDELHGGQQADTLYGDAGNDLLYGDGQQDTLYGGEGDDQLYGGNQQDVLVSGGGNDYMDGGKHNDTFRVDGAQAGDVITVEGGAGTDTIDLSAYGADHVQDDGSSLTVDLGNGQSFRINYSGVENVVTGPAVDDPPTVDAGPNQIVNEGDLVQLSGTASDPEGQGLSYQWVQTSGPAVTLSDPSAASPSFTAPQGLSNSDLTFELRVSDGTNTSVDTVTVTVNADNDAPSADAGVDQSVSEGALVQLSGAGSDPEGQGLSYQWVQTSGPAVTLSDPQAANPSFTAPQGLSNSDLTFELRVSDGTNTSVDTVTVTVNADNDAPSADAGVDQSVSEGAQTQSADTVSVVVTPEPESEPQQPAAPPSQPSAGPTGPQPPTPTSEPSAGPSGPPPAPSGPDGASSLPPAPPAAPTTPPWSEAPIPPEPPPPDAPPEEIPAGLGDVGPSGTPSGPEPHDGRTWDGTEALQSVGRADGEPTLPGELPAGPDPTVELTDPSVTLMDRKAPAFGAGWADREGIEDFEVTDEWPENPPPELPTSFGRLNFEQVFQEEEFGRVDAADVPAYLSRSPQDERDGDATALPEADPSRHVRARPERESMSRYPDLDAGDRGAGGGWSEAEESTTPVRRLDGFLAQLWGLLRGGGDRARDERNEESERRRK